MSIWSNSISKLLQYKSKGHTKFDCTTENVNKQIYVKEPFAFNNTCKSLTELNVLQDCRVQPTSQ